MKESISETWTIQIVTAFVLLFVAFLSLIISYSKCFKTKNEVISIIERYEGFTQESLEIANNYLRNTSYNGSGKCDGHGGLYGSYGMRSLDDDALESIDASRNYRYCVYKNQNDYNATVYYEIVLFYSFNIPVFGNIGRFEVKGTTVDLDKNVNIYE